MNNKIYVPDLTSYSCFVMHNDYIRAYTSNPAYNTTLNYTDYYFKNNYYSQSGTQQFGNYSTLPTCIDSNLLTDEVYYRYDFDKILIIFFILAIVIVYVPIKILFRFFRRFN